MERRLCHWCAYPVDPAASDPKKGQTPFSLDLPSGMRGFWCNPCCACSFFHKFRPSVSRDRYLSAIQEALHHHGGIRYAFAPEPFDFPWFKCHHDPAMRAKFLSLCTYDDTVRRVTVANGNPRPHTWNLLDLTRMVAPDAAPLLFQSQTATADSVTRPPAEGDSEKVTLVGESKPKRNKRRRSK